MVGHRRYGRHVDQVHEEVGKRGREGLIRTHLRRGLPYAVMDIVFQGLRVVH